MINSEGKNTSMMQIKETFPYPFWDFYNVWDIVENSSYPFFQWKKNFKPIIIMKDRYEVYEYETLTLELRSIDKNPTDTRPSWICETTVNWIYVNNQTLVVEPGEDTSGNYWVNISAIDGRGGRDWKNISISVLETIQNNTAPFDLIIFSNSPYDKGGVQTINGTAKDLEDTNLTFSWWSNTTGYLGEGISIDMSLPLGNHSITMIVTDSEGLSSNISVNIEVIENQTSSGDDDDSKPNDDDDTNTTDDDDIEEPNGNEIDEKEFPLIPVLIISVFVIVILIAIVIIITRRKEENEEMIPEKIDYEKTLVQEGFGGEE
jgi:hypothetical protein